MSKMVFLRIPIFAAMLAILSINALYAQAKLGFTFSPGVSSSRLLNLNDTIIFINTKNSVALPVIFFADFPIGVNYYFSTGIGYQSRQTQLLLTESVGNKTTYTHTIQYMQVPATIRLFTNEVALDKRLYFQLGPVFDFRIHEKVSESKNTLESNPLSMMLLLAAGIEMQMGPQTAIMMGVRYSRGLTDTFAESYDTPLPNIRNNFFGIDLSIKF